MQRGAATPSFAGVERRCSGQARLISGKFFVSLCAEAGGRRAASTRIRRRAFVGLLPREPVCRARLFIRQMMIAGPVERARPRPARKRLRSQRIDGVFIGPPDLPLLLSHSATPTRGRTEGDAGRGQTFKAPQTGRYSHRKQEEAPHTIGATCFAVGADVSLPATTHWPIRAVRGSN